MKTTKQITIAKAKEADWENILKLLKDTNLTVWFTGKENYNDFFIVKDDKTDCLICCFSIIQEGILGILKSFAVTKENQGKGIGRDICLKLPALCKELGIKKIFAATEDPIHKFWQKTFLTEIKHDEIKEKYFLDYLENFKYKIKNYFEIAHFLICEI